MKIILLRHGKPKQTTSHKITSSEFQNWVKSYNQSGLDFSSKPSNEIINIASYCQAIVCSQLPRAIESAQALAINNINQTNPIFNEAELPETNGKHLKLGPGSWAFLYRVLWLAGYSKNSESVKQATLRARESANILIDLAAKHECVLLVGHGSFNYFLAKELRAVGWSGPKYPCSNYWSFGVYKNELLSSR